MRLRSRSLVLLVTAAVMTANASTALAAPPKKPAPKGAPAAKPPTALPKAYDEGVALFRSGSYEAALAIFKNLTNIESRRAAAFALEKLGRNEEAIAEFEAFIAGAPPALEDQVKAARSRLAELSAARKGTVNIVTTPAGATIEVVGQPAPSGTSPVELELPPGKYVVRATLAGNDPAEREIDVVPGSTAQEVRLELTASKVAVGSQGLVPPPLPASSGRPRPSTGETPRPPSGPERLGAPILTGVLGALSIGAGVYFGLSALSKKSDYDAQPTEAHLADAETDAAVSTASLTAGAILVGVTVVLLLTKPSLASVPAKGAATSMRGNGLSVRF